MDQRIVVGVGNIYANEALFAAGISPLRAAGRISLARYRDLADAVKRILHHAIERGGTTLRDFLSPDSQPGYFEQELMVYGRGLRQGFATGDDRTAQYGVVWGLSAVTAVAVAVRVPFRSGAGGGKNSQDEGHGCPSFSTGQGCPVSR